METGLFADAGGKARLAAGKATKRRVAASVKWLVCRGGISIYVALWVKVQWGFSSTGRLTVCYGEDASVNSKKHQWMQET